MATVFKYNDHPKFTSTSSIKPERHSDFPHILLFSPYNAVHVHCPLKFERSKSFQYLDGHQVGSSVLSPVISIY